MALALAVAVTPVLAGEHGGRSVPMMEPRQIEPPPPRETYPAHDVLQSLERLRLHPGQDALDRSETARKRPEPRAE